MRAHNVIMQGNDHTRTTSTTARAETKATTEAGSLDKWITMAVRTHAEDKPENVKTMITITVVAMMTTARHINSRHVKKGGPVAPKSRDEKRQPMTVLTMRGLPHRAHKRQEQPYHTGQHNDE